MTHPGEVWRACAPVRVDLSGGYTDCPPFTDHALGRAVNLAVARYATATVTRRPDQQVTVWADPFQDRTPNTTPIDFTEAALRRLGVSAGVDLTVALEVPAGCGLGTSGATGVAILAALNGLFDRGLDDLALARLAALVERDIGIAGGWQDQYAAMLGGAHSYTFTNHPTEPDHIPPVRLTPPGKALHWLQQHLLLLFSPHPEVPRRSGSLVEQVARRQAHAYPDTLVGLYTLNKLADRLTTALVRVEVDELAGLVNLVRRHQALLAPGLVDKEVAELLTTDPDVLGAKPCGGAGPGAAWLVITGTGEPSALIRRLQQAGIRAEPIQVAVTGCHVERVNGEVRQEA